MRAAGGLLIGCGAVLALIAAVWGRSGYYESQAPILLLLALGALACVGAGSAMLRYRKTGFSPSGSALSAVTQRVASAPAAPAAHTAVAPAAAAPAEIDEKTRDRLPCAGDWVLVLPDATVVPIADGLVIGRQPVSAEGGPAAAVPSTEVSKSHARFRIVDGQLRIRDLDTTNGTVVVHPDGSEENLSSQAETVLANGDRLEIGSYALEVQRHP